MQEGHGGAGSSLFAKSRNFSISGGHFYACSRSSQDGHSSHRQEDITYGFRVIPSDELQLLGVICARQGYYRFNSTKRRGHDEIDVVQVFEGAVEKQMWEKTIEFSRRLVNAHVLKISGISPSSDSSSDLHYIVFDGVGSRNTHRVIASMLRKGDRETTVIGSRTVYGIASGLDYISQRVFSLSELEIDEFDVFSDDSGHIRLAFTPNASALVNRPPSLATDVEICNALLRKIFNDANHTIHRDDADQHLKDEFPNSSGITLQMEIHDIPETTTERSPRREIIWSASGFSDLQLSYIYQNYDNLIFNNDTIQLPRRFGPNLIGYRQACSCKGYIREEITLTPDVFRNAVFIYQQPSPKEKCGLCGELLWRIEEVNLSNSSLFGHPVLHEQQVTDSDSMRSRDHDYADDFTSDLGMLFSSRPSDQHPHTSTDLLQSSDSSSSSNHVHAIHDNASSPSNPLSWPGTLGSRPAYLDGYRHESSNVAFLSAFGLMSVDYAALTGLANGEVEFSQHLGGLEIQQQGLPSANTQPGINGISLQSTDLDATIMPTDEIDETQLLGLVDPPTTTSSSFPSHPTQNELTRTESNAGPGYRRNFRSHHVGGNLPRTEELGTPGGSRMNTEALELCEYWKLYMQTPYTRQR